MVPVMSLWLPILLSAVIVFLVSWIIHMFLPYHRTDFRKLPAEDQVLDALRPLSIPAGEYVMPHARSSQEMKEPAYVEKAQKGPVALLTVWEPGPPGAGTGNLSDGAVTIELTGGLDLRKQLGTLVSNVYAPPPGGMALVWTAGGTDATTVGIGGLSFTGTQATSPALSLSITVQAQGAIETFLSTAGECSITIGAASGDRLAGAFTCSDLESGGRVVDVEGVFRAQG